SFCQVTEMWRALKQKVNPLKRKVVDLEENIKTLNAQVREYEESIAEFKASIASLSHKIYKLEDGSDTEEHDVSFDDDFEDDKNDPFLEDCKYSDVEAEMFGSNGQNSKKPKNSSRRQTKKSQAAKGKPEKGSGSNGKSSRGRPLGSKNKTAPKSHLEKENDKLKEQIQKLMSQTEKK
ncbi:UPF0134 protein, partial [Frankliniella fusca]